MIPRTLESCFQDHWLRLQCFLEEWASTQEEFLKQLPRCEPPPATSSSHVQISGDESEWIPVSRESDDDGESKPKQSDDDGRASVSINVGWSEVGSSSANTAVSAKAAAVARKHVAESVFLQQKLHVDPITRIVQHRVFHAVTSIVILANALLVALDADHDMRHLEKPSDPSIHVAEVVFVTYFCVEVAMRLYSLRCRFFFGTERTWNIFDLSIACQACFELFSTIIFESDQSNLSFMRVLRLLKPLKLLRVIRVLHVFRELRLILCSLLGCMKAFAWACLLVVGLNFVFGISIMQGCVGYMTDNASDLGTDLDHLIHEYFGSVSQSMLTLFMIVTGGNDWELIVGPLRNRTPYTYTIFVVYLCMYYFVTLNVINSIFIEAMMAHAQLDDHHVLERKLEERDRYVAKLRAIFAEIDEKAEGVITCEEFRRHADSNVLQAFFSSLDLDTGDATRFFKMLSLDGKVRVDLGTFVDGCFKLKGTARSKDLFQLLHQSGHDLQEIRTCMQALGDQVASLVSQTRTAKQTSFSPASKSQLRVIHEKDSEEYGLDACRDTLQRYSSNICL